MRLIVVAVLLCLAVPFSTPGIVLPHSSGSASGDITAIGYPDPSLASTTNGWSDLYSGATAGVAPNPLEYELAAYSGDTVLSNVQEEPPMKSDKPSRITGITAIVLLIGALRLYFTSPRFRKFLWDTFSPLSPLGYS